MEEDSFRLQYNFNNPSVKRIMRELKEMEREISDEFMAKPLENNLFEWHFTIKGPKDSPFEGGIYHGRILLPADYPFKPPNIVLLTPNGRFEAGKKICLSISSHHPEYWQPGWSIRTVLVALIGFMPSRGNGAIGSLDHTEEERRILALKSVNWKCERCGVTNGELFGGIASNRGGSGKAFSDSNERIGNSPFNCYREAKNEGTLKFQEKILKSGAESIEDKSHTNSQTNNTEINDAFNDENRSYQKLDSTTDSSTVFTLRKQLEIPQNAPLLSNLNEIPENQSLNHTGRIESGLNVGRLSSRLFPTPVYSIRSPTSPPQAHILDKFVVLLVSLIVVLLVRKFFS